MKVIIVLAAIVTITIAFPQTPDSTATVVRNENNNIGVGDFTSQYVYFSFFSKEFSNSNQMQCH